jgi:hypothetical protein
MMKKINCKNNDRWVNTIILKMAVKNAVDLEFVFALTANIDVKNVIGVQRI